MIESKRSKIRDFGSSDFKTLERERERERGFGRSLLRTRTGACMAAERGREKNVPEMPPPSFPKWPL